MGRVPMAEIEILVGNGARSDTKLIEKKCRKHRNFHRPYATDSLHDPFSEKSVNYLWKSLAKTLQTFEC